MNSYSKHNKIIAWFTISIIIIQCILFGSIYASNQDMFNNGKELTNISIEAQEKFINEFIRPQLRQMLKDSKEQWAQYLYNNPNVNLISKDPSGSYIYSNSKDSIIFNENTMYKIKIETNKYNIFDKNTNELLIEKACLMWKREELQNLIKLVTTPLNAFNACYVTVFDTYTGEVFISNDNNRFEDYISLENTDEEEYKQLMKQLDTNEKYTLTSFYYEKGLKNDASALDYSKYPLGKYNRLYEEKIILPYETIGVEGQDMQLTILVGVNEKSLMVTFKQLMEDFNIITNYVQTDINKIIIYPMISVLLSLTSALVIIYLLKKNK